MTVDWCIGYMVGTRSGSGDVDRHKKAATDSLALLDWCIEYFADNEEPGIARRLGRNRNQIQKRLEN